MTRYFRVRHVDEIVGWSGVRHPLKHGTRCFSCRSLFCAYLKILQTTDIATVWTTQSTNTLSKTANRCFMALLLILLIWITCNVCRYSITCCSFAYRNLHASLQNNINLCFFSGWWKVKPRIFSIFPVITVGWWSWTIFQLDVSVCGGLAC